MDEESLRSYLSRREREVKNQIAAINGQLTAKQAELEEIQRAKIALGMSREPEMFDASDVIYTPVTGALSAHLAATTGITEPPIGALNRSIYEQRTIPALTLQALVDGFPGGATVSQLREFFRDAYGRDVSRESLSSQLSRLSRIGLIQHIPGTNAWVLRKAVTPAQLAEYGIRILEQKK